MEKLERKEPTTPTIDSQEKICPVCQEPAGGFEKSKCHCEKEGNWCEYCQANRPGVEHCRCIGEKKINLPSHEEEPEDDGEPKLYQATLKEEPNYWAEILEDPKRKGCETCRSGKARLIQQNCSHCGNQNVKANCCGRTISDCSCPSSQENCGKPCKVNCKPLEQRQGTSFVHLTNQLPQVHYQTFVPQQRKTVKHGHNYGLTDTINKVESRSRKRRSR